MGLTRIEYGRLIRKFKKHFMKTAKRLRKEHRISAIWCFDTALEQLDDETSLAAWLRQPVPPSTNTLLWKKDGPLCPCCGAVLRETLDPQGWMCINQECAEVSIPPLMIGPAIALAMAGASPAEFAGVVLGVKPNKAQTAMLNSRFGTRSQSEARRLFREEMGLD